MALRLPTGAILLALGSEKAACSRARERGKGRVCRARMPTPWPTGGSNHQIVYAEDSPLPPPPPKLVPVHPPDILRPRSASAEAQRKCIAKLSFACAPPPSALPCHCPPRDNTAGTFRMRPLQHNESDCETKP